MLYRLQIIVVIVVVVY